MKIEKVYFSFCDLRGEIFLPLNIIDCVTRISVTKASCNLIAGFDASLNGDILFKGLWRRTSKIGEKFSTSTLR